MLVNDLVGLLMQVPPKLAAAWGVWFFAGLVLSIWQRREKSRLIIHGPSSPRPGSRPPKPAPNTPLSSTDAFGDLAALLDTSHDSTAGSHRTPGEQLAEVTGSNGGPIMAAPQSLP